MLALVLQFARSLVVARVTHVAVVFRSHTLCLLHCQEVLDEPTPAFHEHATAAFNACEQTMIVFNAFFRAFDRLSTRAARVVFPAGHSGGWWVLFSRFHHLYSPFLFDS
jgi:hypothetical protein